MKRYTCDFLVVGGGVGAQALEVDNLGPDRDVLPEELD